MKDSLKGMRRSGCVDNNQFTLRGRFDFNRTDGSIGKSVYWNRHQNEATIFLD
jgi:hypothetical protein